MKSVFIILGSPSEKTEGVKRRLEVFKHCISVLQNNEISNKVASELVGLLMLETDAFPPKCLAILAGVYVDIIKSGIGSNAKCLELFPKILSAVDAAELVEYKDNTMKGSEYKSHTLNTLCSGRWDPSTVTHLAAMFKDVPLTNEELQFVILKISRMFKEMDLQELPPLVYQLLLLSSKGHKRLVLEGVSKFFVQQDATYKQEMHTDKETELSESSSLSDQLRHVEGTILLHISFAMKQDQDLGRDFIKYLKGGQSSQMLCPFNCALALTVARIHRFEDQVFDFLKTSILKSYKDSQRKQDSHWIRELAPDNEDVSTSVLDTVYNSTYGWDQVTQGLVQLGFLLMDAFGPKAAFGKTTDAEPTVHLSPAQKACALGARLLLDTFKAHKMVREEILEQILNRVVIKATASVSHYLDLLSNVVRSAPQVLLDSLPKVREAFDYLSFLPPNTAEGLLKAIQPLLKISMSLKDSLILVLRKAMFSRQVEARRIAVNGFLLILKNFKVLGGMPSSQSSSQSFSISASQVHVDVHMSYNPHSNEALCLEILGNLRRCLTQQADVRTTLYQGFYDVLCKNTQLGNPILSVLFAQWKKYYETAEDVQPPVKLEPCVMSQGEQTIATEPLAHLLSTMVQCVFQVTRIEEQQQAAGDHEDEAQLTLRTEIDEMLESLTRRMIKSELEDFELDKSADFSLATSVGVKNNIYALLVSGMYEVLMEYIFTTGEYEIKSTEEVLLLFQNYHRLTNILKEKNTSKNKSAAANKDKSLLSLRFVTLLLKSLFSDNIPSHQEGLNKLRDNLDLTKYVVTVTVQKLQQLLDKGFCEGPEGHNQEKLFKYCCTLGRVLLKQYSEDLKTSEEHKRDKGKNIALLCLEGFSLTVNIVCHRFTDRLTAFLSSIDPNRDSTGGEQNEDQEQIHAQVTRFQRMVMTVINGSDEDRSLKEAVSLLTVIFQLAKCLKHDGEQFAQIQSWLFRICTEQTIDDFATVKTLLHILYQLTLQQKSCASLIVATGRDIHSQLGDVDQEVEMEDKTNFSLVNNKTAAPTVVLLLLSQIDRELDDIEWVINRMKTDITMADTAEPGTPTQREDWDKSVTTKLASIINSFHELVQSAVPLTCNETMLKTLTRLYGTLAILTKLNLSLYQQKQSHLSTRFEKLVKHSGTKLTQYVYAMITYIQAAQNETLQQAHEKANKKGKDKKKVDLPAAVGKAQVLKETKSIPGLIFSIEQYERYLIQLSKKSKVNLLEHFKMSTSRDFRIHGDVLQKALDDQEVSSEDDSEEEEEDKNGNEENEEPAQKKARPSVSPQPQPQPKKGKNIKNKKLSTVY